MVTIRLSYVDIFSICVLLATFTVAAVHIHRQAVSAAYVKGMGTNKPGCMPEPKAVKRINT
jgi:hypothetical protein